MTSKLSSGESEATCDLHFAYAALISFVGIFTLAAIWLTASCLGAAEPPVVATWELHDSLGHQWHNELLYYRLDLRPAIDPKQSLSAMDQDGEPIPMQVVEQKHDSTGRIAQVQVAIITDLKPFEQRRFRLLTLPGPAMPADLHVTKEKDRWLLTTSKIGVAIPLGDRSMPEGRPLDELPAPVLAIRQGKTSWAGKGWLTGKSKVYSWKSELLADGPVLAKARISYEFGNSERYVVEIVVPAGQQVVLVREDRDLPKLLEYETDPAKASVFHLALAAGLNPTHVYSKRQLGSRGRFVEAGPQFKGTHLTPAQMHWIASCCNIVGTWPEGSNTAPFIGLFPRFLSHWNRPHQTFVPVVWDQNLGLTARFFLNHGSREWGLMAGEKQAMIEPQGRGGEGQLAGYFDALLLNNQWGETPLDKVKDWILDWGEQSYRADRTYAPAPRARGDMPYFAEQFLRGGQKWEDTYIHVHQTWTGEGDGWERYRQFLGKLSADQLLSARAAAAFEMYKQTDPDYWLANNWIGPSNPNMIYMGNASILMGALALHDHPRAKLWSEVGLSAVRDNLARSASLDGAWLECPGYDGAGINPILRAAVDLHRTGLGDLLSDGRLLKVALYHANLVTPPDPRVQNQRHLPEFGDCFDLSADPTARRARPDYWKMLIPLIEASHPREAGQILWALGEKEGPVPIVPIDGVSRQVDGFGSVFRHAFGTPDESYLAIHQDSFGYGHYHFDLGSLYFFAKGAPLCLDWPSMYSPQIKEAWLHNAVSVDRIPRYAYHGRVQNSHLSTPSDYSRSQVFYDNEFPLDKNDKDNSAEGAKEIPQHCWQRQVLFLKRPAPGNVAYLVVRDAIRDQRETDWNLWALCDKMRLGKRRADAHGIYGVDLSVRFFVGPDAVPTTETLGFGAAPASNNPPKLLEDQWSDPEPGIREVDIPRRHLMQQNVIRMASPAGGDYGAVIYPRRPTDVVPNIDTAADGTVVVTADGQSDTLFMSPVQREIVTGHASFLGRAALISQSKKGLILQLVEGGRLVMPDGPGVSGDGPVTIFAPPQQPLEIETDGPARELEIRYPSYLKGQVAEANSIMITASAPGLVKVKVPAGRQRFLLR